MHLANPKRVAMYHDSMIEIRGRLGFLMQKLKLMEQSDERVGGILIELHNILKLNNVNGFKKEYIEYLKLLSNRDAFIDEQNAKSCFFKIKGVPNLSRQKWNMWGSKRQFIFGQCVVDLLKYEKKINLHPIWGCLLSPTGGIIGPGNSSILNTSWSSPVAMHSCVHDASGYVLTYHGCGPGYNYLNTCMTLFPKSSPMSCQYAGIKHWSKILAS